jgi:uncharacterized protein DUF4953/uncharacterized protein DUF5117/uncharacterized protein DUF5118
MRILSMGAAGLLLIAAACSRQTTPSPATPTPQPTRETAPPTRPAENPDTPPGGGGGGGGRGGRGGQGGQQDQAEPTPRPYARVVTSEAVTRAGLFKTHRIGSRLLFEIPKNQLGKDQLVVLEIARTVLGQGYGGQAVGNRVLRWERRDNRMFLRTVSYAAQAQQGTPEALAVEAANVNPIIASFPIESFGPDSAIVVDVTRIFTQPLAELGPGSRIPGNIDTNRTWIDKAVPFPDNVNVYSTLTYAQQGGGGGGGRGGAPPEGGRGGAAPTNPSNTIVFSWSFHKLPETPMMPRLCDDRVGYFSATFTDYTSENDRVRQRCYITRYRLEKKDPNAALSEPVKPIVYYIDAATPKKWVPFLKEAIESWQPAFEAAGFKNAIIAREAPTDDADWSPEDARYSIIRWLPSTTENASGPHVHDPRSGEILNAHIQFYQNVQNLQNSWYFTQAAAVDARARKFPLPDTLMGKLLGYVAAHEVGHTLGFQHNMKASSAYPVDSLRSASFLKQWGHTPTLMDYSRFNYVAQPEDNIPPDLLIPQIGPYDKWATMWGYKPIPNAKTPEDERPTLDQWAREQDSKPYLRFSTSGSGGTDPGELTEAVGDQDAVKATSLGIRNLRRTVNYLLPATVKPLEGFDDLTALYGRLLGQWRTELNHVANIVAGADTRELYGSQKGVRFTPVSRARQKQAVEFLNDNAFVTPTFFVVDSILKRMEPTGAVARIVQAQAGILNSLLQNNRLIRLSEYEHTLGSANGYGSLELLQDVRNGIFSELKANREIDVYRRALQRAYVENLADKVAPPAPPAAGEGRGGGGGGRGAGAPQLDPKLSDLQAAVRAELKSLDAEILLSIARRQGMDKAHLDDLRFRIDQALKNKPAENRITT